MKYLSIAIVTLVLTMNCTTKNETLVLSESYTEEFRPQYHFSPEEKWMNDPNGMVYYEGEYHLFYQYYPDSTVWGPMHWGHAISTNLVEWEHLPIALYPDSLGYIFSGSAVIDWNNTSGFGEDGKPPMVAIFTHHEPLGEQMDKIDFQYQSIAFSNDKGRTWTKYEGNPVIANPGIRDFRDPKVIWDHDSEQWILVLAADDHVKFYGSQNLIDWTHLSDWGREYGTHAGVWECPDLFPMTVENSDEIKWVLIQSINPGGPNGGSAAQYFVGNFDGKNFVLDEEFREHVTDEKAVWLDYGTDNYAGVTWSDIPAEDGRRIFIGWMSNWLYAQVVPTQKWRSAMTLPRVLTLHHEKEGYRLRTLPADELKSLEIETSNIPPGDLSDTYTVQTDPATNLYKLELTFKKPESGLIEIRFSNNADEYLSVGYSLAGKQYFIDRTFAGQSDFKEEFADYHTAHIAYDHENVDMILYLDHSSIELFADQGRTTMTDIFFPNELFSKIQIIADHNPVELLSGTISKLKKTW